jgi:hypothetical protein
MSEHRRRRRAGPRAGAVSIMVASAGLLGACAVSSGAQTLATDNAPAAQPGPAPAAARGPVATFLGEGMVTCFAEGTMRNDKPDTPAVCEVSAATVVGDKVLLASDKGFPGVGRSSIFQVPLTLGERPTLGPAADRFFDRAPHRRRHQIRGLHADTGR